MGKKRGGRVCISVSKRSECVCSCAHERETECIMVKTHKRPCARGTIHYANEAPPYGESQRSAHMHGNMSAPGSQVLPLIFMLNLQKPCNSYLCSVCAEKRREENRMRGPEMDREGRGRRSIEEIRETSQYCLLLFMISIQQELEEAVSSRGPYQSLPAYLPHWVTVLKAHRVFLPVSSNRLLSVNPPTLVHPSVTGNIINCRKRDRPRDTWGRLIARKSPQDKSVHLAYAVSSCLPTYATFWTVTPRGRSPRE